MKSASLLASLLAAATSLWAQPTVTLPKVTVYSDRVANQEPAGTFAMPVSALRFEPRVDIQARNLAEGQADVTLRGGIFEATGFRVGAATIIDPQTGHYFAELPVAPAMLGVPTVQLGSALTLGAINATVGSLDYAWRPIRTAGAISAAVGEYDLRRGELYQGVSRSFDAGRRVGVDFDLARSESDGSVAFGEHEFNRANLRVQYADARGQTDVFAGYQGKRFGWPNMYTPFNSNETENLQTTLFVLNHRADLGGGDFLQFGAYHRRNKDDYAFNRFAPLGPIHPFQHTTRVSGASADGRHDFGSFALNARGEVLADKLTSTSLTFGRYHTRTLAKFAAVPETSWSAADGVRTTLRAGAAFEQSDRDGGALSPVVELTRACPNSAVRRVSLSYTKTTQLPTYTALNSSATAGLFRGNRNLGREKAHNVEGAVAASVAGWETEAAIFWRRDDSLVDWTFRRGVTARIASAVDIDVTGFELVAKRSWAACDLVLGYTALTKDADYRGAAVDASFYALNYARHRLTAAATVRMGHGFELRIDNVLRVQASNPLRVVGGDEALLTSASLAFRPAAWRGVEMVAQIDNLWDSDFQEVPAVPAAGRQFSLGARYVW